MGREFIEWVAGLIAYYDIYRYTVHIMYYVECFVWIFFYVDYARECSSWHGVYVDRLVFIIGNTSN